MLQVYEKIVKDYLRLDDYELIFATGLSQQEYHLPRIYWRLKNHESFLNKIGVRLKMFNQG